MAGPTAKATATRRVLLEAAARLFARKGFAGTSISEIASEVKLNRSLISYHFGGKAGLYNALLQSAVTEAAAALDRAQTSPDSPNPERNLVRAFAEAYTVQPHLAFMLVREHLEPAYLATEDGAVQLRGFIDLTRQVLESGQLSPEAERFDPQVVHLIVVGALIYFLITQPYRQRMQALLKDPPSQPSLEEYVDTLSHLLAKGL